MFLNLKAEREGHSGNFNGDHKSYQIQTASENGVVHEVSIFSILNTIKPIRIQSNLYITTITGTRNGGRC
jgi:hypothetical protein